MNQQEERIEKKLLDDIESSFKDKDNGTNGKPSVETTIRLHGEFVRNIAVKVDAESRKKDTDHRISFKQR